MVTGTLAPHLYLLGEILWDGCKDAAIEREENLAVAASYLIEKGILQHCEYHDEIYGGGFFDLEGDFYRSKAISIEAPWPTEIVGSTGLSLGPRICERENIPIS